MDISRASCFTLPQLAAKWRVLGLMLVAFARVAAAMHRADARGAREKAEALAAFAAVAVIDIHREIAALPAASSAADRQAAEHLQVIAERLALLALLGQRLALGLAERVCPPWSNGLWAGLFAAPLPSGPACAPVYLDTS